jgi:hypothetical protein
MEEISLLFYYILYNFIFFLSFSYTFLKISIETKINYINIYILPHCVFKSQETENDII